MITACALAWRITRHYFSSWKGLVIALITPTCLLLFLGPSLGSMVQDVNFIGYHVGYMTFFLPGIVALTIFYGTVFTSGNMIVMDRVTGFAEMIKVSPNSSRSITFGYVLGSSFVGGIQGLLFLAIGLLFSPSFTISVISIPAIVFMVAGTTFFGAMGFIIGVRVSFDNFSLVFALISIPFVYTSTIFVPPGNFPPVIQFFILINPVSLLVDLARSAFIGLSAWELYVNNLLTGVILDGILCALLFITMFLACVKIYPRFSSIKPPRTRKKTDKEPEVIDSTLIRAITREIGIKNLEEWWPLVKEGRFDELTARFPEEKVKKILDKVKQAIDHSNLGDPGNDH